MPPHPRLGLRGLALLFTTLAVAVPTILVLPTLFAQASQATDARAADVLRATGEQTANLVARVLYAQWRDVEGLARLAQQNGVDARLRLSMELVAATNDRLAWLGVATPDGRIHMAAGGVLEAADIAARPWFRAGLTGPYAGDLHPAVLLQPILSPNAREPLRLLDFALPLHHPDGQPAGVLAAHVHWPWLRDLVRDVPRARGIDVLLLSRDGMVLIGPAGLEGTPLQIRSAMVASQGATAVTEETWPDGQTYLSAVIPVAGFRSLPSFGWSLIVRQPTDIAFGPTRSVAGAIIQPFALAMALVLGAGLWLARRIGRPTAALAEWGRALAAGQLDRPPPEAGGFREAAEIAGALARLQGTLAPPSAPPPPDPAPRVV